jgi:hypothetical protein
MSYVTGDQTATTTIERRFEGRFYTASIADGKAGYEIPAMPDQSIGH